MKVPARRTQLDGVSSTISGPQISPRLMLVSVIRVASSLGRNQEEEDELSIGRMLKKSLDRYPISQANLLQSQLRRFYWILAQVRLSQTIFLKIYYCAESTKCDRLSNLKIKSVRCPSAMRCVVKQRRSELPPVPIALATFKIPYLVP